MNNDDQTPRFDPDGDTQPFWPEDSLANTWPVLPHLPGMTYHQEPAGDTQPVPINDPMATFQAISVEAPKPRGRKRKRSIRLFWPLVFFLLALYFFAPLRTNIVLLGIDRTPDGSAVGRSDTIILTSVSPLLPGVRMLSIPRDLFLDIPGIGQDRINTAHFYAEAQQAGSGPDALAQVLRQSFQVPVPYYLRVRFDGFLGIFNAMGGVTLDLSEPVGIYPPGVHHLDAEQALAFVRDRSGADDFFRMGHAQVLIKASVRQLLNPAEWSRLPAVVQAGLNAVDTNLPLWQMPRLGTAFVLAVLTGNIDNRAIDREMVTPYVTDGGAQVLLPNWEMIHPLVARMFGFF